MGLGLKKDNWYCHISIKKTYKYGVFLQNFEVFHIYILLLLYEKGLIVSLTKHSHTSSLQYMYKITLL